MLVALRSTVHDLWLWSIRHGVQGNNTVLRTSLYCVRFSSILSAETLDALPCLSALAPSGTAVLTLQSYGEGQDDLRLWRLRAGYATLCPPSCQSAYTPAPQSIPGALLSPGASRPSHC